MKHDLFRKLMLASSVALSAGWGASTTAEVIATDTFSVTAEVVAHCDLTVPATLNIGEYNPVTDEITAGSADITVTCTNGMEGVTIGLAYSGTATDEENELTYTLTQDSAGSQAWDDDANTAAVTADGTEKTHTVYGQIPTQATVALGNYADTVTVNVNY